MTPDTKARLDAAWRSGAEPDPADTCATIETEVELEQYRLGMAARGINVAHAVAVRRQQLQARKGVRGSDRP